jgi:hypothetical protein
MAAASTELESVNRMLLTVGSLPAAATTDQRPDVIMALNLLQEIDRQVQSKGHHFNTRYNVVFSESGGQIPIATDVFSVSESSGEDSPRRTLPHSEDFSIRNLFLYDAINDTDAFTADVTLNAVYRIPYEELPQYAREYITSRAAGQLHEMMKGVRSASAVDNEQSSRATFIQEEANRSDANFFNNPYTAWTGSNR